MHFKEGSIELIQSSPYVQEFTSLEESYTKQFEKRKNAALAFSAPDVSDLEKETLMQEIVEADSKSVSIREEVKELLIKSDESIETKDSDYVFLTFIIDYLPHGLIGLLIAVFFGCNVFHIIRIECVSFNYFG